jgi:hypothetical protein
MDPSLTPLHNLFTHLVTLRSLYLLFGVVAVSCFDCLVPITHGKSKTFGIWLVSLLYPLHPLANMDAKRIKSLAYAYIKYLSQMLIIHVLVGGVVTFYHRHEDPRFAVLAFVASDIFILIPAVGVFLVEENRCGLMFYVVWCYAWVLILQDICKSSESMVS